MVISVIFLSTMYLLKCSHEFQWGHCFIGGSVEEVHSYNFNLGFDNLAGTVV